MAALLAETPPNHPHRAEIADYFFLRSRVPER